MAVKSGRAEPAWTPEESAPVFAARHDVVVVGRPAAADLAPAVQRLAPATFRGSVTPRGASRVVDEALRFVGLDAPGLAAEAGRTARSFLKTFGLARANLRLEVVDRQSCPKFHVDRVHVRLLRTFVGAGTEYCRAPAPGDVWAAPPGSLEFLKGTLNPTYSGELLHRSPQVPVGERRLCLVLDFS